MTDAIFFSRKQNTAGTRNKKKNKQQQLDTQMKALPPTRINPPVHGVRHPCPAKNEFLVWHLPKADESAVSADALPSSRRALSWCSNPRNWASNDMPGGCGA